MAGKIIDIQIGAKAGGDLHAVASATLIPGMGVVGDRYFAGSGTFSKRLAGQPDFEVTLIEGEEIEVFNRVTGLKYTPGHFRRNLVTQDFRLNALVGRTFYVGDVQLKGIRLCEPCAYLSSRLGAEIMEHMVHKAGIRAQILTEGSIDIGDEIRR